MCIYCGTTKYRKIYESHVGEIPLDDEGRRYHIHHIDGNRLNNSVENLVALSIRDHYDIHYSQGDWMACHRLAKLLNKSFDDLSELSSKTQRKLVEEGKHIFLGGDIARITQRKLVAAGIHPWQNGDKQRENNLKRVKEGKHNWQDSNKQREKQLKLIEEGKHHLLSGEIQRKQQRKLVAEGNHPFGSKQLENGTHPSQIKKTCEYCDKTMDIASYARSHGEKCKQNKYRIVVEKEKHTCEYCGVVCTNKSSYTRWHGNNCKAKR